MRLRSLLLMSACAAGTFANAQSWVEDTVSLGAGYSNDVFYSLKNGDAATPASGNWHLAFQVTPQGAFGNVSIFANHTEGEVKVYSLNLQASTNFTTMTAADTVGKTGNALVNSDSSWNYGAFNMNRNLSNPFDYGWGKYDMPTHHVNGDSIYLVTIGNLAGPVAYKLWVQQYRSTPADSVQWKFRIARLDGSMDTTIRIYRMPDYTDRLFAYYDVVNQTVLDREPSRAAWDLLFTQYMDHAAGPGGTPYSVTGVLSNFDVTVFQKDQTIETDTVGFETYNYDKTLNAIGYDWKAFTPPMGPWTIEDSTYYFVKTLNTNEYYQLNFVSVTGSSTGEVVLRKRLLGAIPTGISNVNTPVNAYFVAPNPANNSTSVMIDSKEQANAAQLMISDMTGRIVYRSQVNVKAGLNAYEVNTASLPAGTYIVVLSNGNWKAAEKLSVQH